MPFIGIIAKKSDSNFIKNEIIKNSLKHKFDIINIDKESIENVKNIKFETIIINEDCSMVLKLSKYLEKIIKNAKYLIINSDLNKRLELITNNYQRIITYGLNHKAKITISSIKNENIFICIQEEFKDINENIIEQQEINVEIVKNSLKKICNSLAIFAILSIYGENLKKI